MTCVSSMAYHTTSLETSLCIRVRTKNVSKFGGDNNKSRDQVRDKSIRREVVDHDVTKALAISSNTLGDSQESEHPKDASMLKV